MTAITRRQTLIGAAATMAAAALPALATAAPATDWTWTGITWDGRHPSSQCAVWWEDRMHALLWKRVGDQWACLGPIVDPVYTMIDDGGAPGMETYVQAVPAWDDLQIVASPSIDCLPVGFRPGISSGNAPEQNRCPQALNVLRRLLHQRDEGFFAGPMSSVGAE